MRFSALLLGFFLWHSTSFAQRVHMPDLFQCLSTSADKFDACMFREGFVCYKSSGGLNGWTCLFAYQPTPYIQDPSQSLALIQYDRNSRSDILTYQVQSKEQYETLRAELIKLGYQIDPVTTDRQLFTSAKAANTIVTCQPVWSGNGMSGNYTGYLFTLTHRRY
ncbi:hypothetical protein EXU85_14940 [Spirosoma sp. KCTC 42546]|uniref:hypothetical protein n=1 Tax=Spirosoma sp. KCTC 42546 TaxID=2520506 RepID=UPI001156E8A7|nr:hypothetical protein [Spirosoma sp. KCTC 42546]QDK79836.1 hypothetical protein EXU85_14940 [Spirosoma sp. KCTC 42546]